MTTDTVHRVLQRARRPIAVAALLSAAACGESDPGPLGPTPDPIELPRALTSTEASVVRSSNAFGFHLARQTVVRDDRPNVVLSPLSASFALGMTLNGADGSTFAAMKQALAFPDLPQEEINAAYSSLLELLVSLDPAVDVSIANAIWANEEVPFHPEFLEAVEAAFAAALETSDFSDPRTTEAINDWVSSNTHGKIEKIIDELDPSLAMLLLNAIWFDGAWTTAFDPDDTRTEDFHRTDGSTVPVEMMNMADVELPLGWGEDWAAAELPYGGEAWSLVVVVPGGPTTARELFTRLDEAEWDGIVEALTPMTVDGLALPRFTLEYDGFLNEPLMAMGMDEAFRPIADFSRMSPVPLCIDFVRQKTFIEVDEVGTRAAAVTAVGMRPTSFIGLRVDRPFVFALRERLTGTVLFMGLVEDPTAEARDPEPFERTCG